MATTYSAKGTSYPSFKIHKSGPTLYQGTASPTASARNGDLYLQHGTSGRLWIYSQSAWTEVETGLNDALDSFTLRSTHVPAARNVQYILNGTSTDATEIELLIQTTLSADTTLIDVTDTTIDGSTTITTGRINIPDDSAGIVEAKIIARDGVNNENAGYIIKGVIVNDAGTTVLLTDPMEEILGESTSSWYALMEADDTTDSVIVKASGAANATVKWTAFVNVTLATHADPTPTYSLSADSTTVNEGDTVTFTLTTTNVADSTTVAYTVTGVDADDLSAGSLTGNFTISSGTGTAVFTLAEDAATEGAETLTLTLDNGEGNIDVTVTDSSTAPVVSSNSGWVNVTSMTGQAGSANNLFPVPHYIMGASDGSIYVAGREGAADIGFVTKLDTDGNTQWFKQYNDASHFSRLYGIVEDTTGAIYTSGRDYGYGRNAHPSGPELGIISKWTTSGGNTWNKTIKDTSTINDVYPGYDAERCAIDSQNNVWVLGTSTASSTTSRNLLLTKIDSNGTLQAAYNIVSNPNTPSNVSGVQQSHRDIRIDSNDNVYITVNTYEPSNTSYHHALIIKLDSSGTMQWYKIYGIASQVPVYDASTVLQLDSNDNLYIVGSSYPNNNYKPVIYKINPSDGSIAWGRQFSFNGNEVALAVDSQDTLWFAVGDDTNGGVKLFKYDTSGTLLDQWGLDLTVGGVTVGQDSYYMTTDANNNLVMTQRKGGGSPYQVTYTKLPSVIVAGTFGDLTITDTTETDAAYSPNTYTHTTFTVNDVSSSWETVDYNSGSYAITPLVTPSITDNITTVTGGSGGGGTVSYDLSLMANTNAVPDDFVLGTNSSSYERMVWNRDGSGFYTFSEGGGHFDFFSTTTAWDITTATQDTSKILSPTNIFGPNGDQSIEDFEWNEDGTELYVFASVIGDRMYLWKYTVSEAYNLASTLTYVSANNARGRNSNIGPVLDTQFGEEANQTITYLFEGANHWSFADDGTKLSIQKDNRIIVFEMPTAYDPTSIDWANNALYYYDISDYGLYSTTGTHSANTVQFSSDGTRMWVISITNTDAYWNIWIEYTLSTPFDPSSITDHTLKVWERDIIWGRVGAFHVTPTGKLVIVGSVKRDETGTTVHGNTWIGSWTIGTVGSTTVGSGTTQGGDRGFNIGGRDSSDVRVNTIEYWSIATLGNASDFGDMTVAKYDASAVSNGTIGMIMGGDPNGYSTNVIETFTCATSGNASDFGDLTLASRGSACVGDGTYGILGGGLREPYAVGTRATIDYVTMASAGNASDFGDLTSERYFLTSTCDTTRGVFVGGASNNNVMDYITMATASNAIDFGDLSSTFENNKTNGIISNNTRGCFAGGTYSTDMDYITIQTLGNSTDFGNLTVARGYFAGCSDPDSGRGMAMGGLDNPTVYNTIDYWDIATTSDAIDFGDLTATVSRNTGMSGNSA